MRGEKGKKNHKMQDTIDLGITFSLLTGSDWIGLDWIGLDWIGLDWIIFRDGIRNGMERNGGGHYSLFYFLENSPLFTCVEVRSFGSGPGARIDSNYPWIGYVTSTILGYRKHGPRRELACFVRTRLFLKRRLDQHTARRVCLLFPSHQLKLFRYYDTRILFCGMGDASKNEQEYQKRTNEEDWVYVRVQWLLLVFGNVPRRGPSIQFSQHQILESENTKKKDTGPPAVSSRSYKLLLGHKILAGSPTDGRVTKLSWYDDDDVDWIRLDCIRGRYHTHIHTCNDNYWFLEPLLLLSCTCGGRPLPVVELLAMGRMCVCVPIYRYTESTWWLVPPSPGGHRCGSFRTSAYCVVNGKNHHPVLRTNRVDVCSIEPCLDRWMDSRSNSTQRTGTMWVLCSMWYHRSIDFVSFFIFSPLVWIISSFSFLSSFISSVFFVMACFFSCSHFSMTIFVVCFFLSYFLFFSVFW